MIRGNCVGNPIRGFYDGSGQASADVPFNVAMNELNTRIIGFETKNNVAAAVDPDRVSSPWDCGKILSIVSDARVENVGSRAGHDLELVAMQMPGMGAWSEVVDDNLNNIAKVDDVWVRIHAVDDRVLAELFSDTQGSVQRRNLLGKVCNVVNQSSIEI
jgi:hypothetical protein